MDKTAYLRRIGITEKEIEPTLPNLKILQRQHLLTVPFENLDIHWKRPILLDAGKFYEKVVGSRRGGFCYELNGLFYELLSAIGFRSRIISARVSGGKDFGAEYDHLAILTETGGEEFLVDVGFGDFTAEPLRFVPGEEQSDRNGTFLIRKYTDEYFEVAKKQAGGAWKSEYIFKDIKRDLSEFAGMCRFHQTSPESHFTRGKVCSIMTEQGRKTLTDRKFIETVGGEKRETEVSSEDEFNRILEREFNIKEMPSSRSA